MHVYRREQDKSYKNRDNTAEDIETGTQAIIRRWPMGGGRKFQVYVARVGELLKLILQNGPRANICSRVVHVIFDTNGGKDEVDVEDGHVVVGESRESRDDVAIEVEGDGGDDMVLDFEGVGNEGDDVVAAIEGAGGGDKVSNS
ncbi:hypothetical protein VNO77_20711 [Canavalia gladiata]|uniref:Uncharacterized protein n=1 Tax=Canavalia gladiata TaxID=3824 RepID=A0AAN9LPZ9_CANGL